MKKIMLLFLIFAFMIFMVSVSPCFGYGESSEGSSLNMITKNDEDSQQPQQEPQEAQKPQKQGQLKDDKPAVTGENVRTALEMNCTAGNVFACLALIPFVGADAVDLLMGK